jgi:hypothetical protein
VSYLVEKLLQDLDSCGIMAVRQSVPGSAMRNLTNLSRSFALVGVTAVGTKRA